MKSTHWYAGFVLAYLLGFLSCDLVLLKGQLLKSLGKNPQAWLVPQRNLPGTLALDFPEVPSAHYAQANLTPPQSTDLGAAANDLLKVRELKKTLYERNDHVETIGR